MKLVTIPYSKRMFVQLVRRFLNNSFPTDDFSLSENEIMLHIDQGISAAIPKLVYQGAAIDQVWHSLEVPEAFIVRFVLTAIQQDQATGDYFSTLPHPPLSLPLGYSINQAYAVFPGTGKSIPFLLIKSKRLAYRGNMPSMSGIMAWVNGQTFWMKATNGSILTGVPVYVEMPTGRTTDLDAPMNLPDDIIEDIFNNVIQKLSERLKMPRNNVKDQEAAGNSKVIEGNR